MGTAGGNCEANALRRLWKRLPVYIWVTRPRASLLHGTFKKSGVRYGRFARVVGGGGGRGGSGSASAAEKPRGRDQPRRGGGAACARPHAAEFGRELARLHRRRDCRSSDLRGARLNYHAAGGRLADF